MENKWHDLLKDKNDLPTKNGQYEVRWVDQKGKIRIGISFYRLKDKKIYYNDSDFRRYSRTKEAGWSGNIQGSNIIAWREL